MPRFDLRTSIYSSVCRIYCPFGQHCQHHAGRYADHLDSRQTSAVIALLEPETTYTFVVTARDFRREFVAGHRNDHG